MAVALVKCITMHPIIVNSNTNLAKYKRFTIKPARLISLYSVIKNYINTKEIFYTYSTLLDCNNVEEKNSDENQLENKFIFIELS